MTIRPYLFSLTLLGCGARTELRSPILPAADASVDVTPATCFVSEGPSCESRATLLRQQDPLYMTRGISDTATNVPREARDRVTAQLRRDYPQLPRALNSLPLDCETRACSDITDGVISYARSGNSLFVLTAQNIGGMLFRFSINPNGSVSYDNFNEVPPYDANNLQNRWPGVHATYNSPAASNVIVVSNCELDSLSEPVGMFLEGSRLYTVSGENFRVIAYDIQGHSLLMTFENVCD